MKLLDALVTIWGRVTPVLWGMFLVAWAVADPKWYIVAHAVLWPFACVGAHYAGRMSVCPTGRGIVRGIADEFQITSACSQNRHWNCSGSLRYFFRPWRVRCACTCSCHLRKSDQ